NFLSCLLPEFDLPGNAQGNPHFNHQKQDRCSSITDKRKRDSCGGYPVKYYTYIQNYLQGDMKENSADDHRTVKVRRILRNKEQAVQKIPEQCQHNEAAEHSQLFADNRKNHIVLCFRYRSQFLCTVAPTFSEKTAASDRVQRLHDLIASVLRI